MIKSDQARFRELTSCAYIFHAAIALQRFKHWEKIFLLRVERDQFRCLRASGSHRVSPWIKMPCTMTAVGQFRRIEAVGAESTFPSIASNLLPDTQRNLGWLPNRSAYASGRWQRPINIVM